MKILISGATGLVGRKLIQELNKRGDEVYILSRSSQTKMDTPFGNVVIWDSSKIPNLNHLGKIDAVVHLAGEGIADQRWTKERKQSLESSRVEGTKNLIRGISSMSPKNRPQIFVSTSAVGFYGDQGESKITENDKKGEGFLAELCSRWEESANAACQICERTVIMRLGIVLSSDGGALKKMGPAILGSGHQWMSWIHIDDLIQFILKALDHPEIQGVYNLTSPQPVTNKVFTLELARQMGIPRAFVVPVPQFILKAALGEMSSMLIAGQKVIPKRLIEQNFNFKYTELSTALADCKKRK